MEKEVVIENEVMQGCVFVQGGVAETKLRLKYVCFPGQERPAATLHGGFSRLEIKLHSTNLETRGVCVCVSIVSACFNTHLL